MEVSFTLWSMQDVLKKIPFGVPTEEAVHLDFSEMAVPYYVKNGFKVSILYVDDSFPVDASCSIYSPNTVVTVVIIIKQKFEEALRRWQSDSNDNDDLALCCRRKELYCHETSHLIAIIRAFPSDRSSKVRQNFIDKIKEKFENSISSAESSMTAPMMISGEKSGASPSVFDKDHFRYEGDDLNYFRLYDELMLDYDTMYTALKKICDTEKEVIYLDDISRATLVPAQFFQIFPDKINVLNEILKMGFDKED
jgi:hypothetical protein